MDIVKPAAARQRNVVAHPITGTLSERELLDGLRQRARSVHARGRVAEVLYGLALDIFGDDATLHPAEGRWLTDALTMPVSEAAHEAVDTLVRELADVLGSAPTRVRPALARSPVRRIDFE